MDGLKPLLYFGLIDFVPLSWHLLDAIIASLRVFGNFSYNYYYTYKRVVLCILLGIR
jgi:hypothetical protein